MSARGAAKRVPFRLGRRLAPAAALVLLPLAASAQGRHARRVPMEGAQEVAPSAVLAPDTQLIDVPTAGVLDVGGFSSQTRFFSSGGVLEWLSFGVAHRANLGASMNVDRLIGTGSPVQLTRPELQLKFRFYDGDPIFPAMSIGYDGQGVLYNRLSKRYNQRQKGLFLVGSQEIVWPGLQAHGGFNISDFDANYVFGMLALSLHVQEKVTLMTEWDNIGGGAESRANAGVKVYLTPSFHIGFSVRAIGRRGNFSNGMARGPERIFQFKYSGNF